MAPNENALPQLDLPKSDNVVRVRILDTTTIMTIKAESFVKPVVKGHELLNITDVAFLIENPRLGKRVMFDLGCRKDYWKLPPVISDRIAKITGPGLKIDKNASEILEDTGIPPETVDAVVWSHYHWDHYGDMTTFPKSTAVVVGPGFQEKILPGYPTNAKAPVLEADLEGRKLIEIKFDCMKIGKFPAYDYFGDGSFYLLDSPGHCIGHMCGLARVTTDTFVFMGGDICHFAGDFRPNKTYPLPDPIPDPYLDKDALFPNPCPCSVFTDHHPTVSQSHQDAARITPWYSVTDHPRSAYVDPPVAVESVRKMQELDEHPSVLVCIAHDRTLLEVLPVLNNEPEKDLNSWQVEGWKEKCHWGWLNELARDGKRGRPLIVEGLQRFDRQDLKL